MGGPRPTNTTTPPALVVCVTKYQWLSQYRGMINHNGYQANILVVTQESVNRKEEDENKNLDSCRDGWSSAAAFDSDINITQFIGFDFCFNVWGSVYSKSCTEFLGHFKSILFHICWKKVIIRAPLHPPQLWLIRGEIEYRKDYMPFAHFTNLQLQLQLLLLL